MITYLRGTVVAVTDSRLVLDVNNMGYQIGISGRDAASMPPVGDEVKIHTYMSVREDAISLFGFLSEDDLNVYKMLIGVSGVGPKAALSILSVMSADDLRIAVFSDDDKAISKAPGVGPKMAKKVILELKDRLNLEDVLTSGSTDVTDTKAAPNLAAVEADNDATAALVALGYSASEALKAVRSVDHTPDMDSEAILKAALKKLL